MTTTTTAPPVRRLPARDRIRIERYLLGFSWHMQDYPHKEYKQIKAELRSSLRAAALDVGIDRAVADLGSPHVLADQYIAGLGRKLPRWNTGITIAGLAVSMLVYLALAYTVGAIDTLEAKGGGEIELSVFGVETVAHFSGDAIWVQARPTWLALAIYGGVGLVAFLVGARVWRLLTRPSTT